MKELWSTIIVALGLTLGIASIVGMYLFTQPHTQDSTIVANVGVISIVAVWVIALIFAFVFDD